MQICLCCSRWQHKGKKKKQGDKEDLYALIGLANERWTATENQIKLGMSPLHGVVYAVKGSIGLNSSALQTHRPSVSTTAWSAPTVHHTICLATLDKNQRLGSAQSNIHASGSPSSTCSQHIRGVSRHPATGSKAAQHFYAQQQSLHACLHVTITE